MGMRLTPLLFLLAVGCGKSDGKKKDRAVDADRDGFTEDRDCADDDPLVHPDAEDLFGDGEDSNCDGVDGVDEDGDGQASVDSGGLDCDDDDPDVVGADDDGDGSPSCVDCDDFDPEVFPGADEVCDLVDNDCDATIDRDADGIGVCDRYFVASNQVDVLLVVDNSCSMFEEQVSLATAAPALMDAFVNTAVDYQIGVVSTDMNDTAHSGRLRQSSGVRWVDPATPSPEQVLASMIEMGTGGSATEKGLDAAHTALGPLTAPGSYNEGFRRVDADLAVVFVADESDFSTGINQTQFRDFLGSQAVDGFRAKAHAIVSPTAVCPTASTPGTTYLDLADQTAGVSDSICTADFAVVLEDIAYNYEPHHLGVFEMGLEVDPTSLAVDVTTDNGTDRLVPPEITWDAAAQTVSLPSPPPLGAEVTVWFAVP